MPGGGRRCGAELVILHEDFEAGLDDSLLARPRWADVEMRVGPRRELAESAWEEFEEDALFVRVHDEVEHISRGCVIICNDLEVLAARTVRLEPGLERVGVGRSGLLLRADERMVVKKVCHRDYASAGHVTKWTNTAHRNWCVPDCLEI